MEYTDDNGIWLIQDSAKLLIEPSQEWRNKNQGAWLECAETARVNDIITITASYLTEGSFIFNIGGSDVMVDIIDGTAQTQITIDATAQVGDELDIIATHPIYGTYQRTVIVVE
jgi:hypothetical protein